MTTTPALSGRDLALAHNATRAVLETVLAGLDVTFLQSVQLNVLADAGGGVPRVQLVERLVDNLKIGADDADRAIDSLVTAELAAPSASQPGTIERTDLGKSIHTQIQAVTNQIVATLYGGLPTEDLVITHRTLATLTERANRELELMRWSTPSTSVGRHLDEASPVRVEQPCQPGARAQRDAAREQLAE